jgi:hypothetical protein
MHMVFFWLRDPDHEASRSAFEQELKAFINNTPGIVRKHIGTPADTNREVIDNTYTYSLVLTFASQKAHDEYQQHPLHKTFIEKAGSLWTRVQVYDSELLPMSQ